MGRILVGTSGWCGLHPRDFVRHYDVVGNLNQMLPPSSWRQQACWDGFMKRLWFGPCKMQTRRVVPQTLKSKWGMEKHFNSSCLSVFFWGIVWVPVSLPQVCRKLATKSYKLVWFILILVAKTVLLNFGSLTFAYTAALLAYLPRLSQLGFVKHAIQPSQLWFPELQLGPLWLGQQRIVPWAQCSKSGQPWKVVAIEILLNRSCHFFSLAHQLEVKETYAGFDDMILYIFTLASGWRQKATIHSNLALSDCHSLGVLEAR